MLSLLPEIRGRRRNIDATVFRRGSVDFNAKGRSCTVFCRRWPIIWLILLGAGASYAALGPHPARAQNEAAPAEQLIETLSEAADPEARRRAAERLGALGLASAGVTAALIQALGWDVDPAVRGRAAEALGLVGPATEDVVPALLEALEWDDHLRIRWRAVEALQRIGPATEDIVPALIEALLNDKYPGVRARVAQALGTIGPETEHVIAALSHALQRDRHPGVRWQAATALEEIAIRLRDAKATASIASLKEALAALEAHHQPDIQSNADAVRETIRFLELARASQPTQ